MPDHDSTTDSSPSVVGKGAWKAFDAAAMLAAGIVAPRAITLLWRAVTGKTPPSSTRSTEISFGEALAWAALAGALTQVIRTAIGRGAASYWLKSTGDAPPASSKFADPLK